jgi:hypothetical protein
MSFCLNRLTKLVYIPEPKFEKPKDDTVKFPSEGYIKNVNADEYMGI